jgi:hypothetical protein
MYSNVISLDKELDREADFVLDRLKEIKDLSFAVEESKDRLWIYIACICELREKVEEELANIMETVFLSFLKMRFFRKNLKNFEINHANCALISSLIHFDREYENNMLLKVLADSSDYNVDGLLNFRLRALCDNWDELCAVAMRLIDNRGDDCDIYDIASFITGTEASRCQLAIRNNALFNLTNRHRVDIVNLFDEEELNLISAIIREHPSEIIVENTALSQPMSATLKHLARIINK